MAEKYQWYNGIRFTRDDETGYYLNSTIHKRMHVYVWECIHGNIPKGYEVHHKDLDRSNNTIENLQLLTSHEHKLIHAEMLTDEQREWRRNNLAINARPKASEWHKSEEGRAWHKEHMKNCQESLHRRIEKPCINCGKVFLGEIKSKYCCNNCKSAYRRKQSVDLIEATCVVCGKSFMTSKYVMAQCCSRSCGAKLGHMK